MTTYNLTGIAANATNIGTLTHAVNNQLTGGWLITLFIIALGFVTLTTSYYMTREFKKSVIGTLYFLFTLSALARTQDLVGDTLVFITLIGAAAATALMFKQ